MALAGCDTMGLAGVQTFEPSKTVLVRYGKNTNRAEIPPPHRRSFSDLGSRVNDPNHAIVPHNYDIGSVRFLPYAATRYALVSGTHVRYSRTYIASLR